MTGQSHTHRRGGAARVLRIIGGVWRGRRLRFAAEPGIRPTPDRIRETLFNWLADTVPRARCLDLFAGSGALGLEALSRGAAHVTFVERNPRAAQDIETCLAQWDAMRQFDWRMANVNAEAFLASAPREFDVVFLDPPFDAGMLPAVTRRLEAAGWLAPAARIYLECPAELDPPVPKNWAPLRQKRAGQVGYHLYLRHRGIAAE